MRTYGQVVGARGAPRLLVAATLSRLTTSMFSLAVLLAVVDIHGSYANAGAVLTGHAIGVAGSAPVTGRLADRVGARTVLLTCLAVHAAAYVTLLAALARQTGVPAVAISAVLVGMSNPPAAPVTRNQWSRLFSGNRLQAAYAVDTVLNSTMFIVGPLVAGALAFSTSPFTAVLAAGALKIAGDLLLTTAPILRRVRRSNSPGNGARHWLGPLSDARVRLLLAVAALDTFMYGCLQVGAVARTSADALAGLLLSTLAAGEVLGGLVFGARRWPGAPRRQLFALHAAAVPILLVASGPVVIPVLGILYAAAGLVSGSRDVLNSIVIATTAVQAYRTEAFALLGTFMWLGYGVGTAAAGQLEQRAGTSAIYLAAAIAGLAAAVALLGFRGQRRGTPDDMRVTP
ncbi:MAG TPA: MFS transporter [Jiangellaceae bacterium]